MFFTAFFCVLCLFCLSDTVLFDDVIHVFIAAAGEANEDGAFAHLFGQLDAVGNGMGAFDGGDDTLHSGKAEEGVDGLIVVDNIIGYSA